MNDYLCPMSTGQEKTDLMYANLFTGFGDGLLIPFIAGIISLALTAQNFSCLIFLTAAAIIGALAFGIARYFGELSEIGHNHPILSASESEKEQVLMEYLGIAPELREEMKVEISVEKENWLQEVQENQLGWESVNKKRAFKGGMQTLCSFLTGGLLTLLLFSIVLANIPIFNLRFFLFTAIPVLILAGIAGGLKAKFTGRTFAKGVIFSVTYGLFSISLPALISWLLITQS